MNPTNPSSLTRRNFITRVAGGLTSGALPFVLAPLMATQTWAKPPIKAIAFDALAIFDPRPVFALAERLFPGTGAELSNEWRTRQFEYTWLRVATKHYADFWQVTKDALHYAAAKRGVQISREQRDQLMNAYLELKVWPDVVPALASLKNSGFRLAFLSNFTAEMLRVNTRSAGLAGLFDRTLSTDQVKTYKPDPRAYQLGPKSLRLKPHEVLFVAFAGWDAAGAKLFGRRTKFFG